MASCDIHFHRPSWAERNGAAALTAAAFAGIAFLAAALRFWQLGLRTFSDDESAISLTALRFANTATYQHLPELHGPLHVMLTAGIFRAFGDGDAAARVGPAIFGVALALLPFAFVRHIGRAGAIAASLLLAVSPTMLYFSRVAGPDVYLAFFTLASAIVLWRYLADPSRGLLYLLAAMLAFAVTSSEMALAVVPIFAAYLAYRTGVALAAQARGPRVAERPKTHYTLLGVDRNASEREVRGAYRRAIDATDSRIEREQAAEAYRVLTTPRRREAYDRRLAAQASLGTKETSAQSAAAPVIAFAAGWLITLVWPFAGAVRRRLNLKTLPDAAHALIMAVLLMLPFYGPLVEKLSPVGDRGFAGQRTIVVIGGANINPGGELPVMWTTLGVLFAVAMVLGLAWKWHAWVICWATFYGIALTMFTGFFTRRGGVWTGLWGTLDYTWRPEARHADGPAYYYAMLLGVYEFLPVAAIALGALVLTARCGMRNRALLAAAALLAAGVALAPSWLPVVADRRLLLAAIVISASVLALRVPPLTKFLAFWTAGAVCMFSLIGRKDPWLAVHVALPAIMLTADLVNGAIAAFEMPRVAAPSFRVYAPRRLAQGVVAAAFAAGAVFTLRSGVLAGWGHGSVPQLANALAVRDHGDTPIELLSSAQNAPDVREVTSAIARAATESGQGTSLPIVIDSAYKFSDGWGWYLRGYTDVMVQDLRKPYTPPPGAVILADSRNRANVQSAEDALSATFTSRWSFPGRVDALSRGDVTSRLISADAWSAWTRYLRDRTVVGQPSYNEGVAFFPRDLSASVRLARQSDVLSSTVERTPPSAPPASPGADAPPADPAP